MNEKEAVEPRAKRGIIHLGVDGLARENLEPEDGGNTPQRLEYNVLLDGSSTIGSTYGSFGASDYPPVSF
ncbi:hypothetical protein IGI04_009003 [Brassica rapa subsp. trilocularis]|uniref:Uncharacterized protein n=1 Tax=Brassica rapa subsp. trilocularis TaxID=1813537 RepID=A0ABQ7MZE9_BRACM|nr:hypothetical protein IGI04_009003 [Brassica rapa subsp. trilocularis]